MPRVNSCPDTCLVFLETKSTGQIVEERPFRAAKRLKKINSAVPKAPAKPHGALSKRPRTPPFAKTKDAKDGPPARPLQASLRFHRQEEAG